ncbi:MAG: cytochrome c3 family protein [Thermodesulfovibrionales bacterium]
MPTHGDILKVSYGCSACHRGHGRPGTQMLRKAMPELCYDCHGISQSGLSSGASTDVFFAMKKRYRHPVEETSGLHRSDEKLPERTPSTPRHVSCLDCHSPHISEKDEPTKGAIGHAGYGAARKKAARASEICYKCHSDNANKTSQGSDTLQDFDSSNTSYHPVERVARDRSKSIIQEFSGKTMECTDCHVPHGTDVEHMLRANYRTLDGSESAAAYELCYTCHRRDSILGDQSFKYHKKHIVFEGTSCKTCHNAHGSRNNNRLIVFNPAVVTPSKSGLLQYSKIGQEIDCFLNCHGAEHTGKTVARKK